MTDTPNTDQPLDLDAIEARVAECADCAVHDDWIEMANEDRLALLAEVRKLREALRAIVDNGEACTDSTLFLVQATAFARAALGDPS
jgi:hypothetical protein